MDTIQRVLLLNQGLIEIGRKRHRAMENMGRMELDEVDSVTFSIPTEESDPVLQRAFGDLYSEPNSIHFRMIFSTDSSHRGMHTAEMKYRIETVEVMRTGSGNHVGRRFFFKPYQGVPVGTKKNGKKYTLFDLLSDSLDNDAIVGGYTSIFAFVLSLLDPVTRVAEALDDDFTADATEAVVNHESIGKDESV